MRVNVTWPLAEEAAQCHQHQRPLSLPNDLPELRGRKLNPAPPTKGQDRLPHSDNPGADEDDRQDVASDVGDARERGGPRCDAHFKEDSRKLPDKAIKRTSPHLLNLAHLSRLPCARGPVPHTGDFVIGGVETDRRATWRAARVFLRCQRTNRAICLFREAAPLFKIGDKLTQRHPFDGLRAGSGTKGPGEAGEWKGV